MSEPAQEDPRHAELSGIGDTLTVPYRFSRNGTARHQFRLFLIPHAERGLDRRVPQPLRGRPASRTGKAERERQPSPERTRTG